MFPPILAALSNESTALLESRLRTVSIEGSIPRFIGFGV